MEIKENYLRELGFTDFVHLQVAERDEKERMAWMQVVNDEIIMIRVVLINNKWVVEYVSPDKYSSDLTTINDVIKFIKS